MTVPGHTSSRARRPRGPLAVRFALGALGAAGLVLGAGCGVAPAGADNDSPAIGPTSVISAGSFPVFPVPGTYAGYQTGQYTTLQKTVTGTAQRNFHIDAGSSLVFWLACREAGRATLASPDLGLNWSVPCSPSAEPQSINFQPTTGIAAGTPVKVLVTVTPGARWEVRIDIPHPNATTSPTGRPGAPTGAAASSPAPGQPS
jgi:hypothetical protein